MARHGNARIVACRCNVHRSNRNSTGVEGGLSGRDRISPRIHQRRSSARARETTEEYAVRPISASHARRTSRGMKFTRTSLPDVMIVEPRVFEDARGFFMETWEARKFAAGGIGATFVQDNHSA